MNVSVPVRPSDVSLAIKVIIASFVCEIFDVALNFTTYFPADPDLSQTEDFIATMLWAGIGVGLLILITFFLIRYLARWSSMARLAFVFLAVCGVVSTLATESLVIDGANIGLLFSVGFDAVALVLLFGSDSNAWFRAVASSKGA